MFSSCDQVQMKLTQLELNSVRLVSSSNCIGNDLGLSETPPTATPKMMYGRSQEDYAFVHTDSHREFMDLLLERRYNLDAMVTKKEQERRANDETEERRQSKRGGTEPTKIHSSSTNGVSSEVTGFTPVYLPNTSQPCQCSACVGAIAASITKENSRPLNPTDPGGSDVTIQSSLDLVLSRIQRPKNSPPPPVSKEVIWRNWMTTSGSAQLQSDHAPLLHYHHHHHGDGVDGDSGYGDSLRSSCDCHDHTHHHHHSHQDMHNGCSSPSYCTSVANGTAALSSSSTTGAGGGGGEGSSRRYCPCCYCELFGNNGPPPLPTSHNFTKQRDKMRHKLEEKRREKEQNRPYNPQHDNSETDSRPLDELLAFIEGDEEGEGGGVSSVSMTTNDTSKPGKKKKKTKKIHQPSLPATTEEESGGHTHKSHDGSLGVSVCEEREDDDRSSDKKTGPASHTHQDLPSEELSDDYDDELEQFKKICFAAPAVNRKRIAVSLDMNDLMAKMK
jgi:hypothetical protein